MSSQDDRRAPEALETSFEKRHERLKRNFTPAEVPENLDAIVIGRSVVSQLSFGERKSIQFLFLACRNSGIGGMAAAALLVST